MQQQLLRLPQVLTRTSLKRWAVYAKINEGTFPRPVKLGERAVAWRSTDVDRWIESCREVYSLADVKAAVRSAGTGVAP